MYPNPNQNMQPNPYGLAQGNEYPPAPGGYPPAPGGYPPAPGYPPASGGYPPAPGGYPPVQNQYPPSGGYAAPTGYPGYAPSQPYNMPPPNSYPPPSGIGAPISTQPSNNDDWMNAPSRNTNCPPGLEYLISLDQLLVKQKVELLEALTGFETKNKYTIKNSMGQKVFYAVEDSDCCTRCCCGTTRPFDMKILDNFKNEVIHLKRPFACQSCFFPCCLQTIEVFSPVGSLCGSVHQDWSIFTPSFSIKNAAGDTVLKIEGPLCTYSVCGDVEFKILALDGHTQVGKISKQWAGLLREAFTDTDFFGITFPMDLDVKMKAVMIGACFLIDFMFFEKINNSEEDGCGMF